MRLARLICSLWLSCLLQPAWACTVGEIVGRVQGNEPITDVAASCPTVESKCSVDQVAGLAKSGLNAEAIDSRCNAECTPSVCRSAVGNCVMREKLGQAKEGEACTCLTEDGTSPGVTACVR